MTVSSYRIKPGCLAGIKGHLLLLLFIMLVSTLFAQAYLFYQRYQAHRSEQLQANLEIARAAAGMFKEFVQDVLRQELAIGITLTLPQPLTAEQMNAVLARNCQDYPVIRNFAWATPEGRTIASNLPAAIGLDVTTRPYYQQIVAGRDHVISDLYISQIDGVPCFSISRGIRDATGSLLGIIIATVVADQLDQVLTIERAKGGSMALVDGKGMLVYTYPAVDVPWEERNWIQQYPQLDEVLKGREIVTTVRALYEDQKHLVAFTPVVVIGWAVTAGRSEDAALATTMVSLLPHAMVFLLITAVLFGFALVLSRKISFPVVQLRDQVLALTQGESTTPVVVSGPRELKDLADSFNKMGAELRSREAKLREQGEWLRITLSSIGDAVIATDTTGRITFINPVAAELTGWQEEEAEGERLQDIFRIIDEQTREPATDILDRVLGDGGVALLANHTVLIRRDGREIPVEERAAPIKDNAGNTLGLILVFHDVTEKRKAQQALSEVNRCLAIIVDSIADGFFALDAKFRFTHINDAALRYFKKSRQEMMGESIYDVFPRFKGSVFETAYSRALDCGQPEHLEAPSIATDRTVEVHAYPGQANLTVLLRDVTDRKSMEEELRRARDELEMRVEQRTVELFQANEALRKENAQREQSEQALKKERQRFHDVLDMLPAYVVLLNPDYHVSFLNRYFRERFGESDGRRCHEWLFNRTEPCEHCETFTVLQTNSRHHWEWIGPDGRTYDVFDFPFKDTDGSRLIMEVGIDITELRRAEQSLKETNQSLERYVDERTAELVIARNELLRENNRLEAVMAALPLGLAILDERGGILRSNEMYETLWGMPRPSVREVEDYDSFKAWWVDTGRLVRPKEWASARAVQEDETVIGQVMEIQCFDGARKFILNSAAPVHDSEGRVIGCAVTIQDITEIKRAEREVLDRAAELEATFEAQSDVVLTYDTEMNVKRANSVFSSQYGFDPVGLNVKEIIRRVSCRWLDARPFLLEEQPTPRALRGEKVLGACFAVTRADGGEAMVETASGPIRRGDQITGSVTVWHDITELKRVEEELRGSKERFRILSETAGRLLVSDDPQEIVSDLCNQIMHYLDCQAFFNFLVNEEAGRLQLNACAGIPDEEKQRIHWLDYGVAVCGAAAQEGRRIVAEDIPRFPDARTELVKSYGIQAYACHPLVAQGRVIGTLSFGTKNRAHFQPEELDLMRTVADQVATAMQRKRLIGDLQKARDDLEMRVRERTWQLEEINRALQAEVARRASAEGLLREKKEDLESILSTVNFLIAFLDKDFNFVRVNDAFARADQRSPDFFIGKNHFDLYPNAENEAIFKQVVETKQPYFAVEKAFEYAEHPERGVSYWDWSLLPVRDASGEVTRLVYSLLDVTERRHAQDALRQSEELLRKVMDTLPVGVWITDRDGKISMANPAAEKIWGERRYVGLEQYGEYRGWWADTGEPIAPEEWALARAVTRGEISLNEVVEIECFNGMRKTILNSALPIHNDRNEIIRAIVVNQDITELRNVEVELKHSEAMLQRNIALLQMVFDGISDPLIMLDQEGLVTMINKAAKDYYGVAKITDAVGKPCFRGLRGRDAVCPECGYLFQSLGAETMTFEREGLNDKRKVESITLYPVLRQSGRRDGVILKISDVTQAKIIERQLLHNEKLASLGLVTSGIAHEINNPNSFIYFNIPILRRYLHELLPIMDDYAALHPGFELLNMSYAEFREDIFKLLDNMEHGSKRIDKIVGVLKSFVRKRDSGGMQEIDVKRLIDKVVALCHAEIRHKVESFELLVPVDLPALVSDPEVLEQIVLNLLINAVHASDKEDARITLKVEHDASGFMLEVTDNGSGIEDAVLEKIFDPFFTTKSSMMGTGLGLYICHNHVESLGGRIEVESTPGQGSTFRVLLPQAIVFQKYNFIT